MASFENIGFQKNLIIPKNNDLLLANEVRAQKPNYRFYIRKVTFENCVVLLEIVHIFHLRFVFLFYFQGLSIPP